jgi:excinuclease ABC subunit C
VEPQPDPPVPAVAPERSDGPVDLDVKLESLPRSPGCYLFKDKAGAVIYVGKAKSLRARVKSYFQESGSDARYFIPILRRIVRDLETVVTATEKEAAVLENELIKQHQPRFNVKLRDDKDFLCLRLDLQKAWPMLETVRRPSADGARYFGPYHSATSARRTLHLVNKHFQLRTCSDAELATRRRPCLQYQIKRCPAPCVMEVDKAWYAEQTRSVALFLEGRHDELTGELEQRMRDASRSMEFELAAIYRDQLRAVEAVRQEQRVVSVKDVDQDVIGMYREGSVVEVLLLQVRTGRVSDSLSFSLRGVELPDEEVLAGFLTQYYGEAAQAASLTPDEVLLPLAFDGMAGVAEWLGERRGRKVSVLVPQRGPRVDILKMATENAAHAFREKQRSSDDIESRLEELRDKLRLPTLPRRIECCDISHLGGNDTVGSIVSLLDGQLDKKHYRSFHVKGPIQQGDDYAAMYEVLARRFRRGKASADSRASLTSGPQAAPNPGSLREAVTSGPQAAPNPGSLREAVTLEAAEATDAGETIQKEPPGREADWDLPDLLVVDGGRGQLQVALSAARDLGLHDLPIVGLAKERETQAGEKVVDRVYLPGQKNGIPLRSSSSALFFLARARDEAHRFANHVRKKLGKSRRMRSELEDLAGVGAVTRKALLRAFGSIPALRAASDAEILAIPGVNRRHLAALRKVFPAPIEAANTPDESLG